jgi:signal transduction histidine kinase
MNRSGREISENSGAGTQTFDSGFHKMSHDLRTPLNAINGFAELLLLDEGLSPAHADYVRAILTGSEALTATVVSYLGETEAREPAPLVLPRLKPVGEAGPAPRPSLFRYFRRSSSARRFGAIEA